MNTSEAARALGVADSEVVEVRDVGGRLEALHHDMASHEETWRPLPVDPGAAAEPDDEPEADEKPAKRATKRRSDR